MALRWQDVAGQVQAPDLNGASNMITRGLEGLGAALRAPEERRQADLVRQMAGLEMQSRSGARLMDTLDRFDTKQKAEIEKQDQKEFATVRSAIESAARDAALNGIPFDQFLANNAAYQSLDEGARPFADGITNDAYFSGVQLKDQRAERAQNNRVQEAQLAMQREGLQLSRQAARDAAHSRNISDQIAQGRLDDMLKEKKNAEFLTTPLGKLTLRVGENYNDASGRQYRDVEWGELGKKAGIKNYSEYRESLNNLNRVRESQKKAPIPEGAVKSLLATQVGKNTGVPGWVNEVDQDDINAQLEGVAHQYDLAIQEAQLLSLYQDKQEKGIPFSDKQVLSELMKIRDTAPMQGAPRTDQPFLVGRM